MTQINAKPGTSANRSRILLVCISAFAAALLGEVFLRVFQLAPQLKVVDIASPNCVYQRSANPLLGFELKPNYSNESPDFIESYERTNSHGQRDKNRTIEKPPGTKRILLLGDSVVEGYGLPESETISSQLQRLYSSEKTDDPQVQTEVLNFGVSAYCTLAEIELLATKGIAFDPDVVVLVFVENDFDNFNREAFPLGRPIERPSIAEALFKHTYLFRLAFLSLDLFQFRADVDPVAWNRNAIMKAGGENNVVLGLDRFRELATEYDFEPVVAIWPRFEQKDIVDPHPIPNTGLLIVEGLALDRGIGSFRISRTFNRMLATLEESGKRISPRIEFSQGDQLHPSPRGAEIAASAIHQRLAEGFDQRRFDFEGSVKDAFAAMGNTEQLNDAMWNLSDEPSYSRVYNRVGDRLLKEGKLDEAIEQYKKALAEDPKSAATYNNLGIAWERKETPGAMEAAIEHYRKAIELQSDFPEAHFNLGNALESQSPNENQAAQQHFINAIKSKPDFVPAHFSLSRSLLRAGRMKAAEAGFRQILKLDASHSATLRTLGAELAKQQRFGEARELFERYVAVETNKRQQDSELLAEAFNNLGAICASLGDRETAIRYLETAVERNPNHPKASTNLRKLKELEINPSNQP